MLVESLETSMNSIVKFLWWWRRWRLVVVKVVV